MRELEFQQSVLFCTNLSADLVGRQPFQIFFFHFVRRLGVLVFDLLLIITPDNKLGPNWQFLSGQAQGFHTRCQINARRFEHNRAGLYYGYPILGGTLTFTHPNFGWLLGDWFVGEYANPNLAFAFHCPRYGNTSGFNLAGGNPAGFQ